MLKYALASFLMLLSARSNAQIIMPDATLTAKPASPTYVCENDDDACGQTRWGSLGTYDFTVFLSAWTASDRLRFSLQLPTEWQIESAELCGASLIAGHLLNPYAGLEIQTEECRDSHPPVLHLRVACTTQGTAKLWGFPGDPDWQSTEGALFRRCNGTWLNVSPGYVPVQGVSIGHPCPEILHSSACDFCSDGAAGRTDPAYPDLVLDPGTQGSRDLLVWGRVHDYCGRLPECGDTEWPSSNCYGGVEVSDDGSGGGGSPWLSLEFLSDDGNEHYFRLHADAGSYAPGVYHASLRISAGGCFTCQDVCVPIELQVRYPAAAVEDHIPIKPSPLMVVGNPVRDQVNLRFVDDRSPRRLTLSLYDAGGRHSAQLFDGTSSGPSVSAPIPVGTSPGVYFVRAEGDGWSRSVPIVILR